MQTTNPHKVLVVEDEGLIAHDICNHVEALGHQVVAAVGTAEAIEKAADADMVLMGIRLEGKVDGVEAATQIRERYHVPVVFLTSRADRFILSRARIAEPFDYMVKPLAPAADLRAAIKKAIHEVELLGILQAESDRLARSLAEKEILLKEMHHRVKNNLQVIASLLRLQARASGEATLAGALRDSQNRVELMALIHQQLYEAEDLREVDLAKHAEALSANLFSSYGVDPARISRRIAIPPLPLGVDRAIPAGLILNELVSNALKHAFPAGRRGSISIEAERRNGNIVVAVRDDGVGIPDHLNLKRPNSFGLEIVNILTRQLRGTFELDRGQGTTFRISFPGA